jgi:hypothetical protein
MKYMKKVMELGLQSCIQASIHVFQSSIHVLQAPIMVFWPFLISNFVTFPKWVKFHLYSAKMGQNAPKRAPRSDWRVTRLGRRVPHVWTVANHHLIACHAYRWRVPSLKQGRENSNFQLFFICKLPFILGILHLKHDQKSTSNSSKTPLNWPQTYCILFCMIQL